MDSRYRHCVLVRIATGWDGGDVPVDPDGFVHLSTPEQVPGPLELG